MTDETGKINCLKGRKAILRPFDISTDFEFFFKWINDPEIIRHLLRVTPIYRHQQLAWFESLPNSRDVVFTIETPDGDVAGAIGLENINAVNGIAWSWQIIGEKRFRGRGLGTDAKILLLDYGFDTLRLEKICAEIIACNTGSLRYNEKCGFREEGRLKKQIFKDGIRHDLVLLGIQRDEFVKIREEYQKNS